MLKRKALPSEGPTNKSRTEGPGSASPAAYALTPAGPPSPPPDATGEQEDPARSSTRPPPLLLPNAPPPQLPSSSDAGPAAADEPEPPASAVPAQGENPVESMSAVEQSEAPAAAEPGSASPAAQKTEVLDLGPEEEWLPCWSPENSPRPTAFEVTDEVVNTLDAVP